MPFVVARSIVYILLSTRLASAGRIQTVIRLETMQSSFDSVGVSATANIRARFQAQQLLWRQDLTTRNIVHKPTPREDLPKEIVANYTIKQDLGAGSFGEAWLVEDKQNNNRIVVLKIFFSVDEDGNHFFVTWNKASGNKKMVSELETAVEECKIAQEFSKEYQANPKFASRLMRCYEDHVAQDTVNPDEAVFLVLEDCAGVNGDPLDHWIEEKKESFGVTDPDRYLHYVIQTFKQMIEGISYLQQIGWIHHDIKPANIMMKRGRSGRRYVKLIDFGAVAKVNNETCRRKDLVSTAYYAPPEWFKDVGFDCDNPASYDMYAMGVVLDEMLTGYHMYSKFRYLLDSKDKDGFLKECGEDDADCKHMWLDDKIKMRDGVEYQLTGAVQNESMPMEQKIQLLEDTLYQREQVRTALVGVVEKFKVMAKEKNWYPTFMSMVAFDSAGRVGPDEVLRSPMFAGVRTYKDPGNPGHTRSFTSKASIEPNAEAKSAPDSGSARFNLADEFKVPDKPLIRKKLKKLKRTQSMKRFQSGRSKLRGNGRSRGRARQRLRVNKALSLRGDMGLQPGFGKTSMSSKGVLLSRLNMTPGIPAGNKQMQVVSARLASWNTSTRTQRSTAALSPQGLSFQGSLPLKKKSRRMKSHGSLGQDGAARRRQRKHSSHGGARTRSSRGQRQKKKSSMVPMLNPEPANPNPEPVMLAGTPER